MRVLLVSANRERIPDPIFPLGLAYVAAAAGGAGHELAAEDLCFAARPLRRLRQRIRDFRPEVIGLSLRNLDNAAYPMTVDYLVDHRAVMQTVRESTDAPVVLGGSAFSIAPEPYLQELRADYGVVGEGERGFVELLASLGRKEDPRGIPGVITATGPDRRQLPARPAVITAPWEGLRPARHLLDYARYLRRGGMGNVQTKRGCVFHCRYCTYPLLEGNRFRCREPEDVADELVELQRTYGPHPIFFVDSILNFPMDHVESLCEAILSRNLRLRWSCYATPVKLGAEQAELMARAGCEGIELGTDAADDGQLRHLGKSFDADTVRHANDACKAAGLSVCHTVIFGAPGERPESVRNTVRALQAMEPTAVVAMTGVRVYPGTPLARDLVEKGSLHPGGPGLEPTFYIDPAVQDFLPGYLQQVARETGNWVLPGLSPPILPASQRVLRALGVSGPLWKLLRRSWMRRLSRGKYRRPNTGWGVPRTGRRLL